MFPVPGSKVVSPAAQITFRGVPVHRLGTITVTGSSSGSHTGHLAGDSDGNGGSFLPDHPFTPGEVVTVRTSLNVLGGANGTFQFTVARPAAPLPIVGVAHPPRVPHDVLSFHSRRDLKPARVAITQTSTHTAPGDIFLTPQHGPIQNGPLIIDQAGHVLWFKPLGKGQSASNFRVQQYQGRPVLTWWQGDLTTGVGVGEDVINDTAYRQTAVIKGGNGLAADMHEFQITPQGTALITAYFPVLWPVGGGKSRPFLDAAVQEIDIRTGLVLFQWDSLDHFPPSAQIGSHPVFDYFHLNSIQQDSDGNLVISARNTWAVYKIDHQTGAVIWSLGGKHSSFKLAPGLSWAFQHDVRVVARNDRYLTMFDDSGGPPRVHSASRGLKLVLDTTHMTASLKTTYNHNPPVISDYEGSMQQLPNLNVFIGWGQHPYFSEFDRRGNLLFDGRFISGISDYRALKFAWSGAPQTLPALAAQKRGSRTVVFASWNGATAIARWEVLGGASATSLRPVAGGPKTSFETTISAPSEAYVAVQALDASGHVLGTSSTIAVH